jgi:hypothetical protein
MIIVPTAVIVVPTAVWLERNIKCCGRMFLKLNSVEPLISKTNKLPVMELRHIRSFLSMTKTLNFSRTAEIVYLSQNC